LILYFYNRLGPPYPLPPYPLTPYPLTPLPPYPLKGSAVLTGAEYLQAKNQGCKFEIEVVNYIPFNLYPLVWECKFVKAFRKRTKTGSRATNRA
jgi:hypothetical protein